MVDLLLVIVSLKPLLDKAVLLRLTRSSLFAAGISCTSTVGNLILRGRGSFLLFNSGLLLPRSTSTLSIFFFAPPQEDASSSTSSDMGASRGTLLSCLFKAAFSALRSLISSASCFTFSDCFDACALDKSTKSLSFLSFSST